MPSDNETVAQRTPTPPVDLGQLGRRLLEEASSASDGHAALTLDPHAGGGTKHTLIAARAGTEFGPRRWNGAAALQVLQGSAEVAGMEPRLEAGHWTPLAAAEARIRAVDDLVALLVTDTGDGAQTD